MNTKDRLYAWLNAGTFNETDGCRHPQDIIAAALGCTERTVIRCVQQLEREGRLTVDRPRRRGACNTYFVATWNPTKRSDVLGVLRRVRPSVLRARRGGCHPKGNPKRSKRAQTHRSPRDRGCRTTAVVARARVTMPIDTIRDRLDAGGWQPRGPVDKFQARCPAHDDSSASLSVKEADDSRVLLNCFAGCQTAEIVATLGLELRDLFIPAAPGTRKPVKRKPRSKPDRLPATAWPVDRVLARYAPNYRATASLNFWTAVCKVCGGELWIHAALDETETHPSGPVTLACANGCVKNVRGRRG